MAIPTITNISPVTGPSSGGDIVRLTGTGFAASIAVLFNQAEAQIIGVREEAGLSVADVRTPVHEEAVVDVILRNLDENGVPVPGEEVLLPQSYRFIKPRIVTESNLTRLVRKILQELKRQLLENTNLTVSVDYDDTVVDGLNVIALSTLPSLVLSGPRLNEDRFYSTNEPHEDVVAGISGPEIQRRRPPFTVDLSFTITVASDRTVELLNLMAAIATFFNRNRWIELQRDEQDHTSEHVRWEMDPEGEYQTRLDGPNDVRAFTCGFVVRGFDIDEGLPLDLGKSVDETELQTESLTIGGL